MTHGVKRLFIESFAPRHTLQSINGCLEARIVHLATAHVDR